MPLTTRNSTLRGRPVDGDADGNPVGSRRQTAIKYFRESREGQRSKAAPPPMHASWSRPKEGAHRRQISVSSMVRCSGGTELHLRAAR